MNMLFTGYIYLALLCAISFLICILIAISDYVTKTCKIYTFRFVIILICLICLSGVYLYLFFYRVHYDFTVIVFNLLH